MLLKPPNNKLLLKLERCFNIFENHERTTMKLKYMDLETILKPFWKHLGTLWRPSEAILGVLGPA